MKNVSILLKFLVENEWGICTLTAMLHLYESIPECFCRTVESSLYFLPQ